MKWIGIDLGGTRVKGAVIDEAGKLEARHSEPTPVHRGRDGIMDSLQRTVQALLESSDRLEIGGIGVGSAGRIDPVRGRVVFATDNLPGWTGTEIAGLLQERFALPVAADNDVNAAAMGEGWTGAAREAGSYAFIALGTGVGGAYVHDGQALSGVNGGACEFGHFILYPGGTPCNCGQKGCLEQYVSGTALNRIAATVDPAWDSRRILEAYANNEALAMEPFRKFLYDLSTGIVSIQNLFDPEMIILGGGLSDTHEVWLQELERLVAGQIGGPYRLVPAELGNTAGMLGAAKLAMNASQPA